MGRVTVSAERREREARWAAERDQADRDWSRRLRRVWLAWMGWYLLGTVVAYAGLGVVGENAWILVWGGLAIGNIGAWLTVLFFYRAATDRGDA